MPPASPGEPPKHLQIAEALRDAVRAGEYPPGTRLPGENKLMKQYGVQRVTARQAIAHLVEWGIAEVRRGSGTFVRTYSPVVRNGIGRLSGTWGIGQSIWTADTAGRNLAIDQLEVSETTTIPSQVSESLRLAPNEGAVTRSRRYSIDSKPVLFAVSWIPARIAAGTAVAEQDTGPGGVYARLAELGHAPERFREDLQAKMPGPDEIERLQLPAGTPVVLISRTAYDTDGVPIEVNQMTADGSAYIFRYEFDA